MKISASDLYLNGRSKYPIEHATLAAAMLARMINDYLDYKFTPDPSTTKKMHGVHAKMWLNGEGEYAEPGFLSLDHVCDVLDCDRDWVIRRVDEKLKARTYVNERSVGRNISLELGTAVETS